MDRGPESNLAVAPVGPGRNLRADLSHGRGVLVDRLTRGATAAGLGAAMLGACAVAQAFALLFGDTPSLPRVSEMATWNRAPGAAFHDRTGRLIAVRGPQYGSRTTLSQLPAHVPLAFLAAEDRRFRRHLGVDVWAVGRATAANLRAGRTVEGGSTLTQQLAREMLLDRQQTLKRKIQEAALAIALERRLGKDGVLELYLNRVYLGRGAYGVEAAARAYFGKSAEALTLREAALLAALPNAPSALDPVRAPEASARRADLVLRRMHKERWIGAERLRAARREPLIVTRPRPAEGAWKPALDLAAAEARALVGARAPDLMVTLTLDPRAQAAAERALSSEPGGGLVALGADGAVRAIAGNVRGSGARTAPALVRTASADDDGGRGARNAALVDSAGAWQVLQADGLRAEPYLVAEIADTNGRVLWRRGAVAPTRILDPAQAAEARSELARGGRDATALAAGSDGVFAGFTSEMSVAAKASDDRAAAAVWRRFVAEAGEGARAPLGAGGPRLAAILARQDFFARLTDDFDRAARGAPR